METVYSIWLLNDDIEPMVVGVATNKEKADCMVKKLMETTDGVEFCDFKIIALKTNTVIIDDVEYRF